MNIFRTIGVCNDWASESYYIGTIVHDQPFGTVSARNQDESRRIKNGDRLEMVWPNGHVEAVTAVITERRTSYGDMGHTYDTTTEDLVFALVDAQRGPLTIPYSPGMRVRRAT